MLSLLIVDKQWQR